MNGFITYDKLQTRNDILQTRIDMNDVVNVKMTSVKPDMTWCPLENGMNVVGACKKKSIKTFQKMYEIVKLTIKGCGNSELSSSS